MLSTDLIGQRYDIIVHANQAAIADAFWMRAIPQLSCSKNSNADNIRGIIYYDKPTIALPTTTPYNITDSCSDMDASQLIPIISQPLVLDTSDTFYNETMAATVTMISDSLFRWQLKNTTMHLNWSDPTLLQIQHSIKSPISPFARSSAVISVPRAETWVIVVIETSIAAPHPIHLHGHDFLVVSQGRGRYEDLMHSPQGMNWAPGALPKRDTALLPASGHLVLAFKTDNPGAWILHCHIGWHLEQGFALQFVEQEDKIKSLLEENWSADGKNLDENCAAWDEYWETCVILENGSGV